MSRLILVLDDDDERHAVFQRRMMPSQLVQVHTYEEALDALWELSPFDVVYLDYDLNEFKYRSVAPGPRGERLLTGANVAAAMVSMPKEKWPKRVVVHSLNPFGGPQIIARIVADAGIPVRIQPFSFS